MTVGGAAAGLSQGQLRPEVVMLAGGLRPASLKMVSLRSGWLRKGEERALALRTGSRGVILSPLGNDCGQVGSRKAVCDSDACEGPVLSRPHAGS